MSSYNLTTTGISTYCNVPFALYVVINRLKFFHYFLETKAVNGLIFKAHSNVYFSLYMDSTGVNSTREYEYKCGR